MKFNALLVAAGLAVAPLLANAQLTVEITGAGANRLPVAIADFAGERIVAQALTSVVRADLERSGLFRLVDAGAPLADNVSPPFEDLKSRGADAVVGGSVSHGGRRPLRNPDPPDRRAQAGGAGHSGLPAHRRPVARHGAPHFRLRLRKADRRAGRVLDPHRLRGQEHRPLRAEDRRRRRQQRPGGAGLAEPIISPAWSPDGGAWPMFPSKPRSRWSMCTLATGRATSPPTSRARTRRRPGHPTASGWPWC
jgi:TolB protein